jgi:hypothetical protein
MGILNRIILLVRLLSIQNYIKLASFILLISSFCYSCGSNNNTYFEQIQHNNILSQQFEKSDATAEVTILKTGTGFMWDFGQTEYTILAKVNEVLKGDLTTNDTIAFTIIRNENDSLQVHKDINYIVFLLKTEEKTEFRANQTTSQNDSIQTNIKFNDQKWPPTYTLTDNTSGIVKASDLK